MITATGMHMGMIGTEAKATNMATDTTSNNAHYIGRMRLRMSNEHAQPRRRLLLSGAYE
jgi:hypothetical protein